MKKPSFNDIATVGGFLITVGGIVFAAGALKSDVNNLKDEVRTTHEDTVKRLDGHDQNFKEISSTLTGLEIHLGKIDTSLQMRRSRPGPPANGSPKFNSSSSSTNDDDILVADPPK